MVSHRFVKSFYDFADDIEGVNIHYAVTPIGEMPDWESQRSTRYMPLVDGRMRVKALRLAAPVFDSSGRSDGRYALHYYFEIYQGGDRHYSPLYSEEITTDDATATSDTSQRPSSGGMDGESK
jgi:hypothetical protein